MVALWTAHAQLSRFYLDSTPRGRRESGPPSEYKGGVEAKFIVCTLRVCTLVPSLLSVNLISSLNDCEGTQSVCETEA